MSNQEAIALLRNLEDALDSYCELNEEGKTAFRMAIEALSCSENPNNSDCISRQAAIDALCAVCGKACDKSKFVYNAPQDEQVILCPEHYCLCTLPSAQPEPQWIPCSERLPEEKDAGILKKLGTEKRSEYVLATVEVKGERMTVTACTYDGKWDWNMKYAFPDFKVVAWMPLPEPYREERREE